MATVLTVEIENKMPWKRILENIVFPLDLKKKKVSLTLLI